MDILDPKSAIKIKEKKKSNGRKETEIEMMPSKKGAIAGAAAGAALGSAVPIIGTTVGALVGGVAGFIFGPKD